MDVESLGFRTDLLVRRLAGSTVEDRGDHLVVRTPHNPTFYWGNFLLYAQPPRDGEAHRWLREFADAFPDATHVAIGIDGRGGDVGDAEPLRDASLELESNAVLAAHDVTQVREFAGAELRALASDEDWEQAVELRLTIDADDAPAHRTFVRRRMAEFAALTQAGHGTHVGAVVDGVVRATLGLYTDGNGLGRYQQVETHPDFRRRGFAAALLALAARIGRDDFGIDTFVIVAEPDYHAIDLYRRAGFVDAERQVQWQRSPDGG